MGFNKPANPDVAGNAESRRGQDQCAVRCTPEFLLHTGDISHLAKPEEFDTVDQILKGAVAKDVFFVPGEHDVIDDDGKQYLRALREGTQGAGWYSFDKKGVHFIGLVNVMNLKAGGLGTLGAEQLEWLEDDVKHLTIEHADCGVRAHSAVVRLSGVGLGHGRQRAGAVLSEEFGSVTVLNGHIHQTMQKVEGNVTFHTARPPHFRSRILERRIRRGR